jgi:hypothetical protein
VWAPEGEDQSVRQYRFLLRTSPLDALEEAHVEVLAPMARSRRAMVLRAVQDGLVAGLRLSPDDVRPIGHLVALGERRRPGDFLRACPGTVLLPLAEAVIVAEAMFGRFGGYAGWDGVEPELTEGGEWVDGGFGEHWHDALVANVLYRNFAGGPSSPDTAFGGH